MPRPAVIWPAVDTEEDLDFTVELVDEEPPVLVVRGELDFETAGRLRDQLASLTRRGDDSVRVDLAQVTFIDSVGLSVLVQAKKRYDAEQRALHFRPVSDRVRATVDIAGASEFLGIDGTSR